MDPGGPFDTGAFARVPIDIVTTVQVGPIEVAHPASWQVVAGPLPSSTNRCRCST